MSKSRRTLNTGRGEGSDGDVPSNDDSGPASPVNGAAGLSRRKTRKSDVQDEVDAQVEKEMA